MKKKVILLLSLILATGIIVISVGFGQDLLKPKIITQTTTESSNASAPSISWTPKSVSKELLAGDVQTIQVSFTATQNLSNVAVRIVPELQANVSSSPVSFASIKKGQLITLNLTFSSLAFTPPQTLNGTVQLRSALEPSKVFARPLPLQLKILWKSLESSNLSYSIGYPPGWVAKIYDMNTVELIGYVDSSYVSNSSSLQGQCKVALTSHGNPLQLPIQTWVNDARTQAGSPPTLSSDTITVSGLTGIKETVDEIGLTTTVYLPKDSVVFSFELMCGDDVSSVGNTVLATILNSIKFK